MRSLLDPVDRKQLLGRFQALRPDARPYWGRMSAPQMLAHLSDQMRHALGDAHAAPVGGPLRWPPLKQLVMYWLPWPRGRIHGPPEAFLTQPTTWERDLDTFGILVQRFVEAGDRPAWPEHAFFGSMSRGSWGRFCHRHFHYHLRQFGA